MSYSEQQQQQKSSTNFFPIETNWSDDIRKYKSNKEHLEWKHNPKPNIITHKQKNTQDNIFNPITQKYHDTSLETKVQSAEKALLTQTLPKYYDKSLSNEQTYNVVTLQDKLKGFETHPDYPKSTKQIQINKETPHTFYNIISNHSLSKHHYASPEDRPNLTTPNPQLNNRKRPTNINNYKDYDIINCKYKAYDKEKKITEIQIEQLNAAKKLYNSRDYDTIRGVYYDPDKQKQYETELERKSNEHLQKNLNTRKELFNPVNHVVYNKEKLQKKDLIEGNRKLRYTLKPQLEGYYQMKSFQHDMMSDVAMRNKLDYNRFKIQDKRGYDVINLTNTFNNYNNSVVCRNKTSEWDMLRDKAGDNETFTKKSMYIAPYDKSEIDHHKYEFNIKRKEMLERLPPLEQETQFHKKDYIRKNIHSVEGNRNVTPSNVLLKAIDKDKWFQNNKNVETTDKLPYYNKTNRVKSQIFI